MSLYLIATEYCAIVSYVPLIYCLYAVRNAKYKITPIVYHKMPLLVSHCCRDGEWFNPLAPCGAELFGPYGKCVSVCLHRRAVPLTCITTPSWTLTSRQSGLCIQTLQSPSGQNIFNYSHSGLKGNDLCWFYNKSVFHFPVLGSLGQLTMWMLTWK